MRWVYRSTFYECFVATTSLWLIGANACAATSRRGGGGERRKKKKKKAVVKQESYAAVFPLHMYFCSPLPTSPFFPFLCLPSKENSVVFFFFFFVLEVPRRLHFLFFPPFFPSFCLFVSVAAHIIHFPPPLPC